MQVRLVNSMFHHANPKAEHSHHEDCVAKIRRNT
uniref:Uncharacterized protein n=1 Tax=Rhizophora mucronata TaxID=61149 RepID=A0A2P2NG74_RHIMU